MTPHHIFLPIPYSRTWHTAGNLHPMLSDPAGILIGLGLIEGWQVTAKSTQPITSLSPGDCNNDEGIGGAGDQYGLIVRYNHVRPMVVQARRGDVESTPAKAKVVQLPAVVSSSSSSLWCTGGHHGRPGGQEQQEHKQHHPSNSGSNSARQFPAGPAEIPTHRVLRPPGFADAFVLAGAAHAKDQKNNSQPAVENDINLEREREPTVTVGQTLDVHVLVDNAGLAQSSPELSTALRLWCEGVGLTVPEKCC